MLARSGDRGAKRIKENEMTMTEYAKSRGLKVSHISQKMGVSRQAVSKYGDGHVPTTKVLEKIARAMTELGVPTTPVEIFQALYKEEA